MKNKQYTVPSIYDWREHEIEVLNSIRRERRMEILGSILLISMTIIDILLMSFM